MKVVTPRDVGRQQAIHRFRQMYNSKAMMMITATAPAVPPSKTLMTQCESLIISLLSRPVISAWTGGGWGAEDLHIVEVGARLGWL